ncbi:hypothetical protein [Microcoleus phage My-WqHQDG]|nr:hypothetical protein [Microcoleus phage My-WqHQDG]
MVRSKKTVLRVRQELDNYILERGRPLRTLPIPHVNNGVRTAATGKGTGQVLGVDNDTRIPIDQDIANALKLYATTLCKYLVGNGIPAVVGYDSGLRRRSKYLILSNDSTWYVSHYMLDIYTGGGRGPTIWVGMSTNQYIVVESESACKPLHNLLSYLRPLIDRVEGDFLCKECHYSAYGSSNRFCGKGLMPAPQCSGYRDRV